MSSETYVARALTGETQLRVRYFHARLKFKATDREQVAAKAATPHQSHGPENIYNMIGVQITPNGPTVRFSPAKQCIYCGAREYAPGYDRPLGEEHIVSEGMGGTLILPEASCLECEGTTSAAETTVLGGMLWAPRHKLKLPMKRSKIKRTKFPVTAFVDGKEVNFSLPLDTHPTMLFFLPLRTPGILAGRPIGRSGIRGFWLRGLNDLAKANALELWSPSVDTVRFCQFLAKTGHSFAMAMLGDSCLMPSLPDFIRRRFTSDEQYPECYHLIGGDIDRPPSNVLHELGLAFARHEHQWYLTVHMRFFANLGAPTYVAVVGALKPGITPELATSRAAVPTEFLGLRNDETLSPHS